VERDVTGEQPNGQRMNPLGVVSIVEVPNNPRLLTGGVSELYDLTDIQDRINKTLFDRLRPRSSASTRRSGQGVARRGRRRQPEHVEFGRNRMVTTDVKETEFGNFGRRAARPVLEAKREDVKDIASRPARRRSTCSAR
jgi:hypothetical protein